MNKDEIVMNGKFVKVKNDDTEKNKTLGDYEDEEDIR